MKTTRFKLFLASLLGLLIFTAAFSDSFYEPSKPGIPEATDWSSDFIKIKWDAPINDGGSPIRYYIVEMKEKYSPEWRKIGEVYSINKTLVIVGEEGREVQFRVIAVNAAGPSEPSDPSQSITFRPRKR